MHRNSHGLLAFTLCLLLANQASAGWRHNFEVALREAKSRNAPMLVHFYADWCPPCRRMEANVLNRPSINALLDTVIGVKLNSDTNRSLASRFGVSSLPSDVILNPDGTVRNVHSGSTSLATYESRLRSLISSPVRDARRAGTAVPKLAGPAQPGTRHRSIELVLSPAANTPVAEDTADAALNAAVPPTDPPGGTKKEQQALGMTVQFESHTACVVHTGSGEYVGLGGYSPVSLSDARWSRGAAEFADSYNGVVYWFCSKEELNAFRREPEKFVPGLKGCDPVTMLDEDDVLLGSLELAATYDGRTYFFTSRENRDSFVATPARYTSSVPAIKFGPGQ